MRFALILASVFILSVSASAQRGGGSHASSFSGGHIASGAHMGSGAHMPSRPAGPSRSGSHWSAPGNYGRSGYGRTGYVNRGAFGHYRSVPYLWALYPNYYDPFLFDDSGYNSGADYNAGYVDPNAYGGGYDPNGPGPGPDPQAEYLSGQMQQLSEQLNAAEQQPVRVPMAPQSAPAPVAPITLVLKDGRRFQVQNYAVMDQTFWDFTNQPVKKIPLTNIDIATSQRLSAANGADFPDLTGSNGSVQ